MNFFQRRKLLKQVNYLDMVPIRQIEHAITNNKQLTTYNEQRTTNNEQRITLLLPKFKNDILRRFFISGRHSNFIHIKLDALGSATWLLIDGKDNVEQICEKVSMQLGDKLNSPVEQVTKFLTKLYDNRYITYKQLL